MTYPTVLLSLVYGHAYGVGLVVALLHPLRADTNQSGEGWPYIRVVIRFLGVEQDVEDTFGCAVHPSMMPHGIVELFREQVDPIPDGRA